MSPFFCCFFLPYGAAYGIFVPHPGIEPMPPALAHGVLTTGPPGNSPKMRFFMLCAEERDGSVQHVQTGLFSTGTNMALSAPRKLNLFNSMSLVYFTFWWNVNEQRVNGPIVVVHSLSHIRLFMTPWTAAHQAFQCTTNPQSLLKLMSIESLMPSDCLILYRPLLLPSIIPNIRVFSIKSVLRIWWPKYWSFSIIPSNEYSGLISFRIDWFALLAVQGTRKSLLQHHRSKASILRPQLSLWSNSHIHTWLLEKP